MTGKEIVKDLMQLRGLSQSKLAEKVGKSQSHITGYLNRGKNEMRLDLFTELVEAMGCEVVIRDKENPDKEWQVKFDKKIDLDALLS